ncbi:MAG: hypothetical protein HQL73_08075 [Magnetococcales bacterium]|nr:hypothetical protein [Magnetococcales bacterium]
MAFGELKNITPHHAAHALMAFQKGSLLAAKTSNGPGLLRGQEEMAWRWRGDQVLL